MPARKVEFPKNEIRLECDAGMGEMDPGFFGLVLQASGSTGTTGFESL
jgi:hypothetical protein